MPAVYIIHSKKTKLKLQIFVNDTRVNPKNSDNEDPVVKLCRLVTFTVYSVLKSWSQSVTVHISSLNNSSGNKE